MKKMKKNIFAPLAPFTLEWKRSKIAPDFFFFKMLLIDHKNHMLKWLSCGVDPFLSRAEFVFSHLKIDEIDCQKN